MLLSDKLFLELGDDTDDLTVASKLVSGRYQIGEKKLENGDTVPVKNRSAILTWSLCDLNSMRDAGVETSKKSKAEEQMEALLAGDSD